MTIRRILSWRLGSVIEARDTRRPERPQNERTIMAARGTRGKTVTNDRNKAPEVALSQIDKPPGKGSVMLATTIVLRSGDPYRLSCSMSRWHRRPTPRACH